jgi:predicted enzyme related to lactoylglutathione lyase
MPFFQHYKYKNKSYNENMLNLNSIMIGSYQPKVLAEFYEKVFNKKPDMEEGGWFGWSMGSTFFSIGEHSEVKGPSKEPARMIFNFETKEVKEEFERIKKTGAKVIKEPYEMGGAWIATLADPDENYFQLMTPWDNVNNTIKK